jgi:hypothetical protein
MRYPLAWHARHRVSVLSSSIVLSWWYSEIYFCQSMWELGGPVMDAISVLGSRAWPIGPSGVLELASEVSVRPPSPRGVLGMGVGLPSPDGASAMCVELSSLSWMDVMNGFCMNTP